jgi:hypothetical protein
MSNGRADHARYLGRHENTVLERDVAMPSRLLRPGLAGWHTDSGFPSQLASFELTNGLEAEQIRLTSLHFKV